jgi:hypothetical protein
MTFSCLKHNSALGEDTGELVRQGWLEICNIELEAFRIVKAAVLKMA